MQTITSIIRSTLYVAALLGLTSLGLSRAMAQLRDTIPSLAYFQGIEELYEGDYRDAERIFRRELRGAIKTVAARWIDSICYHAMLGEVYYHQGRNREALEQFNNACGMFLQYPKWMLRVKFTSDPRVNASLTRRQLPWGRRGRQFALAQLPSSMLIGLGRLDNREAAQRGGVIQQAQYWRVNVVEIVRTTALAIRRRNELLGPLGAYDATSQALVTALSRGGAPPNHWSGAWIDLQLGLAQVGTGEIKQALPRLERATLLAGKFDHALTCVALAEQGRLLSEAGNTNAAAIALAEASYLAFYYEDFGIIDEAFRLGTLNRLAGSPEGVNQMLEPAAAWARRRRLDHLFARISLALAEERRASGTQCGPSSAPRCASRFVGRLVAIPRSPDAISWTTRFGSFGTGSSSGKSNSSVEVEFADRTHQFDVRFAAIVRPESGWHLSKTAGRSDAGRRGVSATGNFGGDEDAPQRCLRPLAGSTPLSQRHGHGIGSNRSGKAAPLSIVASLGWPIGGVAWCFGSDRRVGVAGN